MKRSPPRACHVCCQLEQWCRCGWWRKNAADVAICVVVASVLAAAWLMTGCEKPPTCASWVQSCIYNQGAAFTPSKSDVPEACVRAAKAAGVCK